MPTEPPKPSLAEFTAAAVTRCPPGSAFVTTIRNLLVGLKADSLDAAIDQVMEHLPSAATEWSVERDVERVTFRHLASPAPEGLLSYVPADQQGDYVQRADGLWEVKG